VVEATGPDGAIVDYSIPAVTDVIDPSPEVFCDPEPGSLFPLGDTIVSCTAVDADGNIAECTFVVSVVDTTPPDIVCPSDRVVTTNNPNGRAIHYNVLSVVDIVDTSPALVCTPLTGSIFPVGDTL
jgi:hypothetical protein